MCKNRSSLHEESAGGETKGFLLLLFWRALYNPPPKTTTKIDNSGSTAHTFGFRLGGGSKRMRRMLHLEVLHPLFESAERSFASKRRGHEACTAAATCTHLESENAATPLGKESIPAPRMFLARLKTDADMLDLSASRSAAFASQCDGRREGGEFRAGGG